MKASCFLVGRQGVRYGKSEDQHSLRERGGMRNSVFQVNQCSFRDVQNTKGQLSLLDMGPQSHVEFL